MVGIWIPADLSKYANGVTLASGLDSDQIEYMLGGPYNKFFVASVYKHCAGYLEVCLARRDSGLPMNLRASTYITNRQRNPTPINPVDYAGIKLAEHEWVGGNALLVGFNSHNEWGQEFVSVYGARRKVREWKERDRSLVEMLATV